MLKTECTEETDMKTPIRSGAERPTVVEAVVLATKQEQKCRNEVTEIPSTREVKPDQRKDDTKAEW